MTRIRPFSALRYDPARVDLGRVIAPPYDVIASDERRSLYDRDPHNVIRLELTREVADEVATDYAHARDILAEWQRRGILRRDAEPALYALRQQFKAPDGSAHTRDGFFALLHLEDYDRRIVRPHERTLAGPKADRLKQLRATAANLSPVYMLYADPEQTLAPVLAPALDGPALVVARDETGASHELTPVPEPESIATVCDFLADLPVVIADGHHRYETALAYRDEQRRAGADPDAACEWLLAYFANAYAPGNLLLPIHRLIRRGRAPTDAEWSERLPHWQSKRVPIASAEAVPALLAEHLEPLADAFAFAADDASGVLRIFWRSRDSGGSASDSTDSTELAVRVIHREIVAGVFGLDEDAVRGGAIGYPKDAVRTARELRSGEGVAALYLNPLSPDDVFDATEAGEVMPQKSTFFYPKLPSGLVFRLLEEGA